MIVWEHCNSFSQLLQASLACGEDEIRKRLGEMSRKLTLLQVNDKVLARKQQLLQEREAGLRKVCTQGGTYLSIHRTYISTATIALLYL